MSSAPTLQPADNAMREHRIKTRALFARGFLSQGFVASIALQTSHTFEWRNLARTKVEARVSRARAQNTGGVLTAPPGTLGQATRIGRPTRTVQPELAWVTQGLHPRRPRSIRPHRTPKSIC